MPFDVSDKIFIICGRVPRKKAAYDELKKWSGKYPHEIYINFEGYACPLSSMPCAHCKFRYAYVCPQCKWAQEHKTVNPYKEMSTQEIVQCVLHGKGFKEFKDIMKEKSNETFN